MRKKYLIAITILISFISINLNYNMFADNKQNDPQHKVKIGDFAPNFTIKYLDGKEEKLSDYRGKVIMLQFTASWCPVCIKEMPFIESEIYNIHKNDSNFAIFGIDLKEDSEQIKKFKEKTGVSYPILLDPEGEIFNLYAEEGAGVTRNIIIDKDGKVAFLTRLFDKVEFNNMKQKINELLAD